MGAKAELAGVLIVVAEADGSAVGASGHYFAAAFGPARAHVAGGALTSIDTVDGEQRETLITNLVEW